MRHIVVSAAILAGLALAAPVAFAQSRPELDAAIKDYLARNPQDVQRIVRDYLSKNPEVMQEAIAEFVKRQRAGGGQPDRSAAVKSNAETIFNSKRQVVLGNPKGDVTLVEFFDYNCGFCKRALNDKLELMKSDTKLRVVLKELPVLGSGSTEAAQVAVAVRMQDAGAKYLNFHQRLLGGRSANKATAMAAAREAGLDMDRIERDLSSEEVKETLEETRRLAGLLGINGTPSYVVGDQVVVGAVGQAALGDRIKALRK
ncbi:MAG: DsbA family protein [Pseudolabrys sp.]|nr:DsbA family protein [Pseudolabrys sp.]